MKHHTTNIKQIVRVLFIAFLVNGLIESANAVTYYSKALSLYSNWATNTNGPDLNPSGIELANGVTSTTINFSGVNSRDIITESYNNSSTGASAFSTSLALIDLSATTVSATTNISANGFTVNWKAVAAPFLILQISKDPTFATVDLTVNNITGSTTSKSFTKSTFPAFDATKVYYVRIQTASTNFATDGKYSNIKAFSTISPPGSGNALAFNGSQYVTIGSGSDYDFGGSGFITIEAWVNLDSAESGNNVIYSKRTQKAPFDGFAIGLENAGGIVSLNVDCGNNVTSTKIPSFQFNAWTHIAVVYNSENNYTPYVNGVSLDVNGVSLGNKSGQSFNSITDAPIIGAYSDKTNCFKGSIDEVRIWNTNLSLNTIQTNMCKKLIGSEANLVGYFRFDEGFGNISENKASLSSTDAKIFNSPTWGTSSAPIGDISTFKYAGSSITLNDGDNFTASGFTLSANQGIHLYKVKQSPNALSFGAGIDSLQKNAYWGVFPIGISNYNIEYLYGSNYAIEGTSYEAGVVLASRTDNTSTTWNKVSTDKAETENNLISTPTLTGRNEIIAALGPLPSNIIYVDKNASGANNGVTWTDAYKSLTSALSSASSGNVIHIAQGTYYASSTSSDEHLTIPNGVKVYGGFKSGDTFIERDSTLATKQTIISGDFQNDGIITNNTNSIIVINGEAVIELNTLIFEKAYSVNSTSGGVLENTYGTVNFKYCNFRNNNAPSGSMGAVALVNLGTVNFYNSIIENNTGFGNNASLIMYQNHAKGEIVNCIIRNNTYDNSGTFSGSLIETYGTLSIKGTLFKDNVLSNTSSNGGKCITFNGTNSYQIINTDFVNNKGGGNSGACIAGYASTIELFNCKFIGNSANNYTVLWTQSGKFDVFNTLFFNNKCINNAGSLTYFGFGNTTSSFLNSTFANNASTDNNFSLFALENTSTSGGNITVNLGNSIVWGNPSNKIVNYKIDSVYSKFIVSNNIIENGQYGGINKNPLFKDIASGDLSLTSCSPAINAGNDTYLPNDIADLNNDKNTSETLPIDLASKSRKFGAVDLGAYEYQTAVILPTAIISGNAVICSGDSAKLSVQFTGAQPWNLTYTDGTTPTTPITINGITASPYTLSVSPTSTKTYSLTSVNDANCTGTVSGSQIINVNPLPVITPIADQTVCDGSTLDTIKFVTNPLDSILYSWSNSNSTIGLSPGGTTPYIPKFGAINTGNAQESAQVIVTPTLNTCVGKSDTFLISVKPKPTITQVSDQVICAGDSSTPINFGSVPSVGTSYAWTNSDSLIGLPISSNGNISAFVTSNAGFMPIISTVNVTPTLNGCVGGTIPFTFTVNPTPKATIGFNVSSVCKTGTKPVLSLGLGANAGVFTIPSGIKIDASNGVVDLTSTNAGTYVVTNTIAASGGCSAVSDTALLKVKPAPIATISGGDTICSGSSANLSFALTGAQPWSLTYKDGTTPTTINGINVSPYTLSVSPTSTKNYTITAINDAKCIGSPNASNATVTVNPLPVITSVADQMICAGSTLDTIKFVTNPLDSILYSWSNSNSTIGLSSGGTTPYIPKFGAINTGNAQESAQVIVTPTLNTCVGKSDTFLISIKPQPTITQVSDQVICAGDSSTSSFYVANIASSTFKWYNDNKTIGLADSANGNIATFKTINADTISKIATIQVFANLNGCLSNVMKYKISVNPLPVITPIADQVVCVGASTNSINFKSKPNATFNSWSISNSLIGLTPGGTGFSIPSFVAQNSDTIQQNATLIITPRTGSCFGKPDTFLLSVKPKPTITQVSDQVICAGDSSTPINFGSVPSVGTTFAWTNSDSLIGLPISSNGNISAFVTSNAGFMPIISTVNVTPTLNGCVGGTIPFTFTVNPTPKATIGFNVSSVCKTGTKPVLSLGLGANAGVFTIPSGIKIDASNGVVDLTSTNAGTYVVTNTIAASGGCVAVIDTALLKITPAPNATFSYAGSPFCSSVANPSATFSGGSGGIFTSTTGLEFLNTNTGLVDLKNSTPGTYTVTNTIAASGSCASATSTSTITIQKSSIADFTYIGKTFCDNFSNPSPTFTNGGVTGNFTFTPTGLSITPSTGLVNLSASTPGKYLVTNTIPPLGVCSSVTATSSLIILPRANTNLSQTACGSYFFNGLKRTVSGTYLDTLTNKLGCDSVVTLNLTIKQPSTSTISQTACGSYFFNDLNRTVSGTYKDTLVNAAGCDSIITLNLTINPLPIVKATASLNPVCLGAQTKLIGTGANSYTWNFGKIDNQLFSPTKDTLYTVTGKDVNNCTATDTITIKVKNCTILSATISGSDTICNGALTPLRIDLTGKAPWNVVYNNGFVDKTITGILTSPYFVNVGPPVSSSYKLISVTDLLLTTSTNVSGVANVVLQEKPLVNAGNNALICNNASQIELKGTVKNAASSWTSTGSGTFADTKSDTTTYTLSTADKSLGTIFFYLESNSKFCTKVIDTLEYTLDKYPTANAGNDTTICDNLQIVYLHGKKTGAPTGVTWTSNGSGTFNNQNAANADYTFSTNDLTKFSIAFYMKTTGGLGVCPQVEDTVNVGFKATPKLTFVSQMDTICNGERLGIKVKSSVTSAAISWSTSDDAGIIPSASGTGDSLSTIPVGVGVLDYQFVATSNGCESKYLIGSVVLKNCLKAGYSVNKSTLSSVSDTVTFTSTSTGGTIDSYTWSFGPDANPQTSNSAGPIKVVFSQTGKKVVSLTVKSGSVTNTYIDSLVEIKSSSKLQIIVSDSTVSQSSDSIVANINVTNGKKYKWISEPANAVTFSDSSANPVIKFTSGISGKITVKAIVTFNDNSVDSSEVLIVRNGEYQVSVSKTKAYYVDTIPVTVNFKGTGPFEFKYQIGKDSATIKGITTNAYTFNVSSPGQLNVLRIFDKDNVPINYIGGVFPIVVLDTVSTVKQSTTSTLCTVATSKLYLDITGGKAPYLLGIGSNNYTVNAKDTLDLTAGKYTGTITDAAGYVTQNQTFVVDTLKSNFNTIIPKIQGDTAILAQRSLQNLNVNVDLNNLTGLGTNLKYVWTYTQNPSVIVNSISSTTALNTNTLKINGNVSGTVNLQVLVYTGTCSTAVSTPYKIHVKPNIVKNTIESNNTKLVYDLIGSSPFRLNLTIDSVTINTTVTGNQYSIDLFNKKSLGVISIQDSSGVIYYVNIYEENKSEFILYEAFSPNNDTKNETFEFGNYMYDNNTKFIKNGWDLKVYDRNGFEVFRKDEYKNDWNGGDLADGVYFWVFTNPKIASERQAGFVEIRR